MQTPPGFPRSRPRALLLTLILVAALAGCGATAQKSFDAAAIALPAEPGAKPSDVVTLAQAAQQSSDKVVYSASLAVTVQDPGEGSRATTAAAVDAGGFRVSESVQENRVDVVVRVPPKAFQSTIDAIARLGTVKRRDISSADISASFVDLETRLKNAKVSRDRLAKLLADSVQVDNIVKVEGALQERQTLVEQLEGQMRLLKSQVSLSTISATFVTPKHANDLKVDHDVPGFARGLRNGWAAFRNGVAWTFTAIGASLPFLVLIGLLVGLGRVALSVWRVRRRNLAGGMALSETGDDPEHAIGPAVGPAPGTDEHTPPDHTPPDHTPPAGDHA